MSRITRFLAAWQHVSPRYAMLLAIGAVVPKRLFDVKVATLHTQSLGHPSLQDGTGVRWATIDELANLQRFDPKFFDLRGFLETGARVAVIERDGAIAGWCFFHSGQFEEYDWLRFRLPDDGIWLSRGMLDADLRGQGAFNRIMGFAALAFAEKGYRTFYSISFKANASSVKVIRRAGGQPFMDLSWVRLLGLTLVCLNGVWRLGCWTAKRRMEITLEASKAPAGTLSQAAVAKSAKT